MKLTKEQVEGFVAVHDEVENRLNELLTAVHKGGDHKRSLFVDDFDVDPNGKVIEISTVEYEYGDQETYWYTVPVECLWREDGVELFKEKVKADIEAERLRQEEEIKKREEARAAKELEKDRAEYERLKKKFEGEDNAD